MCNAIASEVRAVWVTDFPTAFIAADVLTQNVHLVLTTELRDAGTVMPRHGEDQVRFFHQLAGEQSCAVTAEVEAMFQANEICAFGCGRTFPGARPGGGDGDLIGASGGECLSEERFGHGAAAGVAGADEENAHTQKITAPLLGRLDGRL